MATPTEARTFTQHIQRAADIVYGFTSDVDNLPKWASALGARVDRLSDVRARGYAIEGPIEIEFTPVNPFFILDHWVTTPEGARVYVPMRVVPHGHACFVLLTLIRLPDMSDERYREDGDWMVRDLAALKAAMEA